MSELRRAGPDTRTLKEILDDINNVAVVLINYHLGRQLQEDIAEIAERFAAGGWISVDDALPKTDVRVIVYCDDPFDIPPHFPHRKLLLIGYLDMENNWYDSDGPLENVTHWMPLPKPPEVKE